MQFRFVSTRVLLAAACMSSLGAASACSSDDSTEVSSVEAPLSSTQRDELDAYVGSALERFSIPGAAVAVVRGRDVIYERGFGVRGVEDLEPVTPSTRFMQASITKAMTSLMLATLVDEGKLAWNTPIVDLLPSFELASAASTSEMRMSHLLSHSSGIGRLDTSLFFQISPPTELITSLRQLPVLDAPGEAYQYHNQMYAVAGYLGALADGAAYDDASLSATYARLMQERLFSRIGMPRATLDFDVALADADRAGSHSYDGRARAIAAVPIDIERFGGTTAPSSSVWADLRDLEAYTSTQLSGVTPGGERIVSRERLDELYTPVIAAGEGQGSALGWTTRELLGLRAVSKDGDGLGFTTEVLLLPDADLGVVVLTNRVAAQPFYKAVEQFAVETVLSMEHAGDAALVAENDGLLSMLEDLAAATSIVSREQAEPYLGRYGDDVRVEFGERGLVVRTLISEMPLVSLGAPGVFASGGVLNGRFKASFDTDAEPMQLTLDLLLSEEGVPQELTLDRTGE